MVPYPDVEVTPPEPWINVPVPIALGWERHRYTPGGKKMTPPFDAIAALAALRAGVLSVTPSPTPPNSLMLATSPLRPKALPPCPCVQRPRTESVFRQMRPTAGLAGGSASV